LLCDAGQNLKLDSIPATIFARLAHDWSRRERL
jgi:hypothetical protein